ncbi:MAG: winged helix-turn-helix domain-containing protein [Alphaproteobacteria bacterium]|nr:winged helix-turn-helix domain-containing protein [Alphaproteobacteria bacterium]
MINVKIYSENNAFKSDLAHQIKTLSKDYNVDDDGHADILILDEDIGLLDFLREKYDRIPIFVLLKKGDKKQPDTPFVKYISKPLQLSGFLNTLQSAMSFIFSSNAGILSFNGYELSPLEKELKNTKTLQRIKLTEREVEMLLYLYKTKDKVTTKNDLLQEVWGYRADVSTHTVETHIYRLRRKVEKNDDWPVLISTENGGYKLNF